jgi:hypothetical protein
MVCYAICQYILDTGIWLLRTIKVKCITDTNLSSVFNGNKKAMVDRDLEGPL